MKQSSSRKTRQITSAPSGRPARSTPPPVRKAPRAGGLVRWFTRSRLAVVLGVVVLATILTIMYYRLTSPDSVTPSPTPGTPEAVESGIAPAAGSTQDRRVWVLV